MKPKALFVLDSAHWNVIYGPEEHADIRERVELTAPPQTAAAIQADPSPLREAEILFSGWGAPVFDSRLLASAPRLRLVLYGAGSIRGIVTDAFWDRGVRISSAYGANAVPVAEYTLSQILFCLKHGWLYALQIRKDGKYPPRTPVPGAYRSTVGIVSLGMIGRRVCQLLKAFDLKVLAYDPFASADTARDLNAELCSLDRLFRESDVISLHTPWLKETENMIRGAHFEAMKPGTAFVNTARGAIVHETEMIAVLTRRPELFAVLDVTYPEPPVPGSPLYTLPNVILTPHIAGAMDRECSRMGRYMVEELERYLAGHPLQWEITREIAAKLA